MAQFQPEETRRVIVTAPMIGFCLMQVCVMADATDAEVLEVANRENPSGTTGGWVRVLREPNHQGPIACARYPERLHLFLEC